MPAIAEQTSPRGSGVTRDAILTAALTLFLQRGFAATRVEDIAQIAGVGKGSVYLHFRNKEELFQAVIDEGIVASLEQAEAAARSQAEQQARAQADAEARRKAVAAAAQRRKLVAEAAARRKAEAAAQAREQAARQRQAEEARNRSQREADLRARLADEERRTAAVAGGLRAQYVAMIQARIQRNWIRPASARPGLKCQVRVAQIPGGEVVGATLGTCNGDEAVRQSIVSAVLRSSPLPMPPDPSLFERNLVIEFVPED